LPQSRASGVGKFSAPGAVVLGTLLLGEPANPARLFFLALLLVAIVGLCCYRWRRLQSVALLISR
jgi:quaternary ammonium compound-resistance protein SugE